MEITLDELFEKIREDAERGSISVQSSRTVVELQPREGDTCKRLGPSNVVTHIITIRQNLLTIAE